VKTKETPAEKKKVEVLFPHPYGYLQGTHNDIVSKKSNSKVKLAPLTSDKDLSTIKVNDPVDKLLKKA